MKTCLITICGRAGSKGFKNKNLKIFNGKPLVYYTLSAADLFIKANPELDVRICLNTDSDDLAALVAERYPEVVFLPRGEALAGDTVPKMDVFKDSLLRMEAAQGAPFDIVIDLDITSPLRTAQDITNAYNAYVAQDDLDLIFSVTPSRRNPYFNMVRQQGDYFVKVMDAPALTARQQAPAIYDLNASIYVLRRDFLANNTTGILWEGKIGISTMLDTGILDIDSEEDFQMMEIIAQHLYTTNPDFIAVRENIRD